MVESVRNNIISAIGHKAKEIIPKGAEVFLFGSQARGDAHIGSDWDILILLDKDRITVSDMDDYSYPLWELGLELGENVNAVLYTKKFWHDNKANPFVENVSRERIRL